MIMRTERDKRNFPREKNVNYEPGKRRINVRPAIFQNGRICMIMSPRDPPGIFQSERL